MSSETNSTSSPAPSPQPKAIVLNAPIDKALEAVKNSPSAQTAETAAQRTGAFPAVDKTAKWFSTRERSQTYMDKKGLTASHEIVQTQKQRFEIRPKAAEQAAPVEDHSIGENPKLQYTGTKGERGYFEKVPGENGMAAIIAGRTDGKYAVTLYDTEEKRTVGDQVKIVDSYARAREEAQKLVEPPKAQEQQAEAPKGTAEETAAAKPETATNESPSHLRLREGDQPISEASGIHVGDQVDVKNRTIGRSTVEELFNRNLAGIGQTPMARIVGATGHRLVLNVSELTPARAVVEEAGTTVIQPADTRAPAKTPSYGAANKLFTAERAEAARQKLRAKFKNQLNAGIDPELLEAGIEITGYHIEAGAHRFLDVARAVAADLGVSLSALSKHLRAWYNGARDTLEDHGLDVSGMDDPDTVRAQAPLLAHMKEEPNGELPELDQTGAGALEGEPSETVSSTGSKREAGSGAERGGGTDLSRVGGAGRSGIRPAGRVGDGAGELPVSARPGEPVRDDEARQPDVEAQRAGDGNRPATRRDEKRGEGDTDPAAERIESQVRKNEKPPETAATPAPQISGNFVISNEDEIGEGGQRQKVQQNLAAIRLLKQLAQEGRAANRADQAILAKYVGWGGLKAAFPREDGSFAKGWEATGKELRDLLGPEEYKAAANSTQNAHYTSPAVVSAIWQAVRRLGFGGGRVLEPSVGVGNFFGLMPAEMREHAQLTGVEKDSRSRLPIVAWCLCPVRTRNTASPSGSPRRSRKMWRSATPRWPIRLALR